MTNKTLDQLTALPLPPLTSDLIPILRPSVGVLESISWGSLVSLLPIAGQIAGLTLSTAGGSASFGVAAGQAANSTNTVLMVQASAYTKTTSAWVAGSGNGALDTGVIANATWYHVYLIQRSDTGLVDVLVSTSATSPTLPTSYTSFRRIGSMKTDGSAKWQAFIQTGNKFEWATSVLDVNGVTPTSGATNTVTLASVPSGVNAEATITAVASYASGANTQLTIWSTAVNQPLATMLYCINTLSSGQFHVSVDVLGQIKTKLIYSGSAFYTLDVTGWTDMRGAG